MRDEFERDAHEFGPFHEGIEVKVGYVHCCVAGIGCGDSTVDVAFDGRHVNSGCAGGAFIVVMVVSNGEPNSVHFGFEWFECGNDANVANCTAFWDMVERDGFDGFSAVWAKATEFIAPPIFPFVLVWAFKEVTVFEDVTGVRVGDCVGEVFVLVRRVGGSGV